MNNGTTSQRQVRALALILVLLAALFRIPGLAAPLFVDESPILRNVAHFVTHRTVIPEHFSYPPLFSYLAAPATGLTALVGGWHAGLVYTDWAGLDAAFGARHLVLGGRILSLICGLMTVYLAVRISAREGGLVSGALAGLAIALSPVSILYGACALPDIPASLAALGAVAFSMRHLQGARRNDLLWAGALAGVAAALKYNGALATLPVAVAALGAAGPPNIRARHCVLAAGAAIGAFLLLAPTWLLTPGSALDGFLFETRNVRTARIGAAPIGHIALLGDLSMSEVALVAALVASVGALLVRRDRTTVLLLAAPLANFLVVGTWAKQDANYFLPTLPIACVLLAHSIGRVVPAATRPVASLAIGLLLLIPFVRSSPVQLPPFSADRMTEWMRGNVPRIATVCRVGLHTPKVWDEEAVDTFVHGPGAHLSFAAKARFAARVAEQPRAARVIATREDDPGDALHREGAFLHVVITESLYRQLSSIDERDAANLRTIDRREWELVRDISHGGGWTLLHRERRGSGPALLLFRLDQQD